MISMEVNFVSGIWLAVVKLATNPMLTQIYVAQWRH